MNIEAISLSLLGEAFEELSESVCENWEGNEEPSPVLISKAMLQLLEVLEQNDAETSPQSRLSPEEIDELGPRHPFRTAPQKWQLISGIGGNFGPE